MVACFIIRGLVTALPLESHCFSIRSFLQPLWMNGFIEDERGSIYLPSMRSEEISSRAKQERNGLMENKRRWKFGNCRIWLLSVDTSEEPWHWRRLHRWTNPVLVRDPAEGQTSTLYSTEKHGQRLGPHSRNTRLGQRVST